MLERLGMTEVNTILSETIKVLSSKGFICGSTFIMDATDIKTTKKCVVRA